MSENVDLFHLEKSSHRHDKSKQSTCLLGAPRLMEGTANHGFQDAGQQAAEVSDPREMPQFNALREG